MDDKNFRDTLEEYLKTRLDEYIEELVARKLSRIRELEVKTCIGFIVDMLDDFDMLKENEVRLITINNIES